MSHIIVRISIHFNSRLLLGSSNSHCFMIFAVLFWHVLYIMHILQNIRYLRELSIIVSCISSINRLFVFIFGMFEHRNLAINYLFMSQDCKIDIIVQHKNIVNGLYMSRYARYTFRILVCSSIKHVTVNS